MYQSANQSQSHLHLQQQRPRQHLGEVHGRLRLLRAVEQEAHAGVVWAGQRHGARRHVGGGVGVVVAEATPASRKRVCGAAPSRRLLQEVASQVTDAKMWWFMVSCSFQRMRRFFRSINNYIRGNFQVNSRHSISPSIFTTFYLELLIQDSYPHCTMHVLKTGPNFGAKELLKETKFLN